MAKKELIKGFFHRMLSGTVTLLLGALLIGGCSREGDSTDDGASVAVNFMAGIQSVHTTDGRDSWAVNDQVGIYMLTADGNLTTPDDVLTDNAQYNVTDVSTGALSPQGGRTYYPMSGNVDFIAYYPFGAVTAGEYAVSVAGQTTEDAQHALDVLYAKKTNVAKSTTAVGLTFDHVLSKVTLNVTLGKELSSLQGSDITQVEFSGMPQTATLALQGGTLTAGTAEGKFTALKTEEDGAYAAVFNVLLVPQTGMTGRQAVFTVNGETYTWTIGADDAFEAGIRYIYPVTVSETGVILVGTATIADWETNDNGTAPM